MVFLMDKSMHKLTTHNTIKEFVLRYIVESKLDFLYKEGTISEIS